MKQYSWDHYPMGWVLCAVGIFAASIPAVGPEKIVAANPEMINDVASMPSPDSAATEHQMKIQFLAQNVESFLQKPSQPVSSPLPLNQVSDNNSLTSPTSSLIGTDLFSDYLLGPGDQIRTDIIGYEAFDWATTQRVVLSDGSLRIPLAGTVLAAGKTLESLEAEVTQLLRQELVDPEVDMSLVGLRPVVVNIVGDVYRPGPVQLGSLTQAQTNIASGNSLTTTTTTPTLTAALAAAGGIRHTADVRQVVVRRRLADGRIGEYGVDLWSALIGESNLGVLVMFDGDVVYVPQALADTGIDQRLLSSSSIAPTNVRVRVIGDGVIRPGEVQVQPNSSVSGAIAAAGGPNADAALGEVRLVRLLASGQVSEQTVDLSSLVDTYQIQDGDVVVVPKRAGLVAIDNFNRTIGPVLSPITGVLSIFNLFGLFD